LAKEKGPEQLKRLSDKYRAASETLMFEGEDIWLDGLVKECLEKVYFSVVNLMQAVNVLGDVFSDSFHVLKFSEAAWISQKFVRRYEGLLGVWGIELLALVRDVIVSIKGSRSYVVDSELIENYMGDMKVLWYKVYDLLDNKVLDEDLVLSIFD
jgi:hypothetical protein